MFSVTVAARLRRLAASGRPITKWPGRGTQGDSQRKVDFEVKLRIKTSVPWVTAADQMVLLAQGRYGAARPSHAALAVLTGLAAGAHRSMVVRVDPTQLGPGVHFTEIQVGLKSIPPTVRACRR